MAQKVSELNQAEDEKKAIMSEFKSRIDGLSANVNLSASHLNNGYEMRTVKCEIRPDWDGKQWMYIRQDNLDVHRTKAMTADDLQMHIDEVEAD